MLFFYDYMVLFEGKKVRLDVCQIMNSYDLA